jgi:hypothetical protein
MLFFRRTDFEAREDHTYSVEVTARRTDTGETTTKTITVTVTDLDDEAPTNIQINDIVSGTIFFASTTLIVKSLSVL